MNILNDTTTQLDNQAMNEDKLLLLTYKERMAYFEQATPKQTVTQKPLAKVLSLFKKK